MKKTIVAVGIACFALLLIVQPVIGKSYGGRSSFSAPRSIPRVNTAPRVAPRVVAPKVQPRPQQKVQQKSQPKPAVQKKAPQQVKTTTKNVQSTRQVEVARPSWNPFGFNFFLWYWLFNNNSSSNGVQITPTPTPIK